METNKHGYVPKKLLTETGQVGRAHGLLLVNNDKHEEN